ncbi:hypothetical protein TSAR_002182 [Trichomalopsis sarcophagae]|uniref:Lipase n=1 Tax=Trichomalopsis sarcophagae TaxID=543379 RepID=A0A232EYB6_9HYME|nr:hypothetical protein TSAR_002182 [Trichomalopsis sarcophagae]
MMRESFICSVLLLSGLVGCGSSGLAQGFNFFDYISPLSIKREKSLGRSDGVEKIPVLDFIGLVKRHDYPAEEHKITTLDGYLLRLHRIPGSQKSPSASDKPVVFLQHGILASSDQFVIAGPERDLAFILADAGYDVWLGNIRGNTYSRSHVQLSPDRNPEFWQFSMHEMGLYDASAAIDHILQITGQQSIIYVGHSMGTSIVLILLSCKPEYNDKIRLVINMASVGYWIRPRNFIKLLKDNGEVLQRFLLAARITEVFPQTLANGEILNGTCRAGSPFQHLCMDFIQYVSGYSPELFDTRLVAESFSYFPAGGSTQTLLHFYQNIKAGKMQMYDHGLVGNFARYNQRTPPVYNLENIVTPVVLIYGRSDAVATPEDSMDLLNRLRNARAESVPYDNFNHLDFIWGKDTKRLLQNRIMQIIENFMRNGSLSVL